jgi:hypothetical protein
MKKSIIILCAAVAAIVSGCVVTSVSPYYTEKELVNEPAIAGHWLNAKNPMESWTFSQPTNFSCRLTMAVSSKATDLQTHVFKLRGQLFLDIYSLEQDYHVIPVHYLLKVDALSPVLKTSELDETWLDKYFAAHPNGIRHHFVPNNDNPDTHYLAKAGSLAAAALLLPSMAGEISSRMVLRASSIFGDFNILFAIACPKSSPAAVSLG